MKYNNEPYLRAEDLLVDGKYQSPTLEIEAVVYGCPLTRKLKPCEGLGLKFKGREKVLGLGTTNESLMKVIAGDARPESWNGKKITLEVRMVQGQQKGETQPAIRIIPPSGTVMRSGLVRQLGAKA